MVNPNDMEIEELEAMLAKMKEEKSTDNDSNEVKPEIQKNKIYNSNCEEYLDELSKGGRQIDSIILDPPYFNVVDEKWDKQWKTIDDYLTWIENIVIKLEKVSKHNCSLWIFGFPYQLSYIQQIVEKYGFKYRQHITVNKGMRSVAGRTSNKLKMFPVATEYIIYFYKDSRDIIKKYLQDKQKEKNIKSSDINLYLGKAINGGGTWSTIAGKRQKNIQYPTKEDWNKLEELFGEFDIKYDDYVYTFNIEPKLTDVWDDINFYDKKYKKFHPTQKPYKLIERLIKCSSNEKYNILDPFMGSSMTALVCKDTNRNYYGCELDKKYFGNNLLTPNVNTK
jgi:adenine-specific DNA-methyltransferase